MIMRLAILFVLVCGGVSALTAASWENTVTINGVGRAVFVPDTSRPVKAVLITNFDDPNLQGRPDVLYPNADLRALGAKWNMMQMHWIGRPESDAARLAEYNGILATLKQVAVLLDKPEIEFTGIFIQGLSGTAAIAADIARYNPSRFGGVIQTHFSAEAPPSGTPCLYVVGGLDTTVFNDITLTQQLATVAPRVAAGEPGTISLEPGQPHDTAATDQKFAALWLDEILTLRFPATIPTTSMINLPSWKDYHAWTGCFDAGTDVNPPWNRGERPLNNTIQAYPSSDGRPCIWLPSQRVAQAWKSYMDNGVFPTSGTSVTLTAPAAGTEYDAGATVSATATPSATSGSITRVDFYDNGVLVGTDTSSAGGWTATWTINSTAAHALTANATNSNGGLAASSPVNVLVRRPADAPGATVPGVNYAYYENAAINGDLPDFTSMTPVRNGSATTFDITAGGPRAANFAYRFTGYVTVATAGSYTFFTTSDDGSKLYIGAEQVVDNGGAHGAQERSGTMALASGQHAITVAFAQGTGGASLSVQWQGPGVAKAVIPSSALARIASGDTTPPATPAAPTVTGNGTTTPTLSGTTEAGATVRVFDGGVLIATTTANGSGAWSVTLSPLSSGSHALTVTATDSSGNASSASPAVMVTSPSSGDTTPPTTPAAPTVSGGGTATPTLSGTTEAGATVRVYDGGVLIATTTANGSGAWSVVLTLGAGSHTLTVTATDTAGNASNASPAVVVSSPGGGASSGASDSGGSSCGLGAISAAMLLLFIACGLRRR